MSHEADRVEDGKTLKRTCHQCDSAGEEARALGNRPTKTKAGMKLREKLPFKGKESLINTLAQYCRAKIDDFPMIFIEQILRLQGLTRLVLTICHDPHPHPSASLNSKALRCYLKGKNFNYWLLTQNGTLKVRCQGLEFSGDENWTSGWFLTALAIRMYSQGWE